MIAATPLTGSQIPRICAIPDYVSSAGEEAIEVAAMAGLQLDEWQRFVLVNSLGERADGKWAAPTVGLVVGRQNGKNAVLEAREIVGLFLLGELVIVHSAHEQATSSEHFRRLLSRIESVPEFDRRILRVSRGKGAEAIELRGGQRVLFKTRTGGGGRGFSVDLLVYDEAMILSAAAKAALVPTLAARSMEGNTQTWYAGSAVDQMNPKHDGVELARIREEGVKGNPRIAYFEWSAPGDNPETVDEELEADPEMWALANPGLGIRISPEWIEHEREIELGHREFAVERLGIGDWPRTDGLGDTVLDPQAWDALKDRDSVPIDPVCFAADVSPDRSYATVTVAARRADGLLHTEIVRRERGTGWVASFLAEKAAKWKPTAVIINAVGAAASLLPELEKLGVEVTAVSSSEYAAACGLMFDVVDQERIRHLGQPDLSAAVRGARKRALGERWAWDRNSTIDISPLVGCTLAVWGVAGDKPAPVPRLVSLADVDD